MAQHKDKVTSKFSALPLRIFSAICLVAIIAISFWLGTTAMLVLIAVTAIILMFEWLHITKPFNKLLSIVTGIIYISTACISLFMLYINYNNALLYLLVVIAATDVGAYFSGKIIGGAKLLPKISPNKTWAGLIGGMACAAITSYLLKDYVAYPSNTINALILGATLAFIAQSGDYFESWLKRKSGVKDSGNILPGHGGLFDRMDGILPAAIAYFAMLNYI